MAHQENTESTYLQSQNHPKKPVELYHGMRLEVRWEIAKGRVKSIQWWGGNLLLISGNTGQTHKIEDNSVAVYKIDYDPYLDGGFPERSSELVCFLSKRTLILISNESRTFWREEGEKWEPSVLDAHAQDFSIALGEISFRNGETSKKSLNCIVCKKNKFVTFFSTSERDLQHPRCEKCTNTKRVLKIESHAVKRTTAIMQKKASERAVGTSPIIVLDDSFNEEEDDDDDVVFVSSTYPTLNPNPKINWDDVIIGLPAIKAIGSPNLFPHTINTRCHGPSAFQHRPDLRFVNKTLEEIKVTRESHTVEGMPFIWPIATPIPAFGGGFYEELASKAGKPKRKISKYIQSPSRVARLAGLLKVNVEITNLHVAQLCLSLSDKHYILAEELYELQSHILKPFISKASKDILVAIFDLNDRDNPFKERCLYALAELPIVPSLEHSVGKVAELQFHVYFRRALFGLSAHPNIKTLLSALIPLPGSAPWIPCRKILKSTNVFQKSHVDTTKMQFEHSLPGILWENENTGYPTTMKKSNDHEYQGVQVELRDYQLESVAWAQNQENREKHQTGGGLGGLNGYFWERRTLADGDQYFYFPLGGHVLLHPPPTVSGGLLTEEMGLGKTIITLELICSDAKLKSKKRGGTLIVVTVSLLVQWQNEIRSKAPHLKYFVYHGDNVTRIHSEHSRKRVVDKLRNYDIVLTTMSKLVELTSNRNQQGQLMNCLKRVSWHRLVVDECQFLKNDTTAIARAASEIDAKHIWMLSGTPLTNKLDDLRGELSLLRVWPFTLGTSLDEEWQDHFWSNDVKSNWDTKNGKSLPLIRNLMAALSMRHSRLQTRLDGSQLVDLPPRTDGFMAVTMDSASSATFINHWVEALAIKVLQMLGRFDVRITALIGKLQQYATNPALICKDLDLLDNTLSYLDTRDTIRVVDLETAISTEKKERSKDPLILSELINLANMRERCLPLCEYCKKVKKRPSYMSCGHSLCAECCGFLLRDRGQFGCPFCKTNIHTGDIVEVEIPAQQMLTRGTKSMNTAIHLDLEDSEVEKVLANQRLFQPYNPTEQEEKTFVQLQPASTYNVVHQEDGISFQEIYGVHTIPTFASLMDQPRPTLCLTSEVEAREKISSISNPEEMEALIWHAVACKNQTNPKINAICSAIQKIRDSSLEAKICIFSSYRAILDEVEDALDNVRYTVEYNMNTKDKLLPGQHVIYFENRDGKDTNGVSEEGTVVKEAAPDEWSQGKSARECANYKIKIRGERFIIASRNDLRVPPVEVDNVKSKLIRRRRVQDSKEEESREVSGEGCEEVSGEGYEDESEQESEQESAPPVDCNDIEKLSVNGSDDRYAISMPVEGKRSPAPSDELKVGYKVRILPVGNLGLFESGCIVAVNRKGNENFLSYDVLPDGHTIESNVWNDQFVVKKDILRKVPPSRLRDKGEHNWLPAVIKGISCKNNLNDLHFVKNDSDPFETALGYVRVDGSAGTANRRGEILDTFKSDPMTSICLLTKRAAGVGINLTEANHVIILEPSMDAHDELQSICRVHRIGQTRKVSVQKFYIVGSIEERILKRRQQRGELSLSINSFVGMSTDEEGTNKKELKAKTSEILSSKSMTYEDLQLLLGVLN